jgi:hypothetical protein
MATQVQNRRGTTAEHSTFTGAVGELTVDITKDTVVVHDGSTAGGAPLLREDGSNSALALGSAASPSLKFTGDTNTGIYSPGADQLAISSSGSERIRIGANGEIGIGGANYGTSGQVLTSGGSGAAPSWTTLTVNTDKIEEGNSSAEVIDTGSDGRFVVTTEGTERLRVDSSGRVGLGTSSPISNLHVQAGGTGVVTAGGDAASDVAIEGASRTYGNGYVANLAVVSNSSAAADAGGGIVFGGKFNGDAQAYYAGLRSGKDNATAGNYSGYLAFATRANGNNLSERMRIDSSGKVGIGTTPSKELHVYKASGTTTFWLESGDTQKAIAAINIDNNSYSFQSTYNTGGSAPRPFVWNSVSTEQMRLDTSGRLLVGTSSAFGTGSRNSFYSLTQIRGNTSGSDSDGRLSLGTSTVSASVTSGKELGRIVFTDGDGGDYAYVQGFADGSAGSVDYPGRLVFSTTADGASSPTERMRIASDGSIFIAKTGYSSGTVGIELQSSGFASWTRSGGSVGLFNRLADDGDLVLFRQADVTEGSISVSGTTVSYNGAHLSRWSQLAGVDPYDKTARPEILRGTVMSNLDEMCDWTCPTSGDCQDNEQLNKTEISSVDDDPNVAGVFQSWDDDDDTWVNDFYLAMTGDFVIRIAAGTIVQRGDLLCSAGDGTARPQGDRYIKDSTIAKVTSTTVSCTHPDGSYCVPCVLMAC